MGERIVLLTPNWLGDAVMALPAVAAVRHHHPAAALIVASRPSIAPLFRMVPAVDQVVTLQGGWAAEARALAEVQADIAILQPNSFRSAFVARRAGVVERWGYAADLRGFLLTRAVARPRGSRHQSDYYNFMAAALGMPAPETPVRLVVPDEARARASTLLARQGVREDAQLVGMGPGAAYGRAKQWPPERFAHLAALLHRRRGVVSVLVGSRADRAAIATVATGPHLVDLVGATDLAVLAGILIRCLAFVSNDSGAMHLAAAAGLPVTALFGPTNERETAPMPLQTPGAAPHEILTSDVWCRPCMLRECPIDHRCMTGIDPDRACEAVERQLSVHSASREL